MKLLGVTCLKECLADFARSLKQADIDVFNTSKIVGHREGAPLNLLDDWLASGGERVNSLMTLTFIPAANAEHGMALIKDYKGNFPVRAFVVPMVSSV
jgi:hypothetical protein